MKWRKTVSTLIHSTTLVKDRIHFNNFKLQVTKSIFSSRETINTDSSSFKYNSFDLNRLIINLIPAKSQTF
jgi:hypothetical protein